MKKNKVIQLLTALVLSATLAGCTPSATTTTGPSGTTAAGTTAGSSVTTGAPSTTTPQATTPQTTATTIPDQEFSELLKSAAGSTVTFYGWGGSEVTNAWIDGFLSDAMKTKYDITVKRVGMNIDEILSALLNEKQLNVEKGNIDVVWINGENFFTAKENDLLLGAFADRLPNFRQYIDKDSPDVKYDFGAATEGYEVPYGKAQLVMIYNKEKIANPPKGHEALLDWAKQNPGKFTYPAPPDFTGSAFVRNIISDVVGYEQFLTMEPDYETVKKAVAPAMAYLKELKPYLWNKGKTYPAQLPLLDNMYADGEVYLTMDYNPNSASSRIASGEFPAQTGTFIFDKGTIGNTHFVSIPFNAPNQAGALALLNEIISVEAQAAKYDPAGWGDLPVLENSQLTAEEKAVFAGIKLGSATLPQSELFEHRIPEMPAKLVPIIEQIWMETIPGE